MSDCKAQYKLFDADGHLVGSGDLSLPTQLDWMHIDVKSHWFRFIGQGHKDTKFALLSSQGEQRLLTDISLTPLDYTQYKERLEASYDEIEHFVQEGGYSRVPRNQ